MADKTQADLKRLMEFYFGDINLSRDQYSVQLLKSNDNKVPLKNINETYPKLMAMKVTVEQIRDALKDSDILSVDESFNLSRKVPFDESKNFNDQAVYVKGFPRGIQLSQISSFFATFGVTPELISFHRNVKNATKGTFDMFFKTKEDQEKILQAFNNQTKEDDRYKQCNELFKNVQIDKQDPNFLIQFQSALLNRLVVIPLSEYLKQQEEENMNKNNQMTKKESDELFTYVKGLVLKITNIDTEAGITRKDIQNQFQKYGEIKFIEYQDKSDTAYVRYRDSSPDAPVRACQDHEKEPVQFGTKKVSMGVLENTEEEEYWRKIVSAGDRKWKNNKNGKRK